MDTSKPLTTIMKTHTFNFLGSEPFQLFSRPIIDPNGNLGLRWEKLYWHCPRAVDQLIQSSPPSTIQLVKRRSESSIISVAELIFVAESMLNNPKEFNESSLDFNFRVMLMIGDKIREVHITLEGFIRSYFTYPWQADYSWLGGNTNNPSYFRRK